MLGRVQLLCDPVDCSLPGSSVVGFLRQEYWSGLPFPSPRDLPDSWTESMSPTLADRLLTTEPLEKPLVIREKQVRITRYYYTGPVPGKAKTNKK